jgi:hypothetical protein
MLITIILRLNPIEIPIKYKIEDPPPPNVHKCLGRQSECRSWNKYRLGYQTLNVVFTGVIKVYRL